MPNRQNKSERGRAEKGFVDKIPVVVNRQRRNCKQNCREKAGHEAEHFNGSAKKQNRDGPSHDRRQPQLRFRQIRKRLCPVHPGQRQSKGRQRRAMAVLRIIDERLFGK